MEGSKKTLGLLYFGRLDDEKGFGIILDTLQLFIDKYGSIPFSLYVFGKGKYVNKLINLGQNHPSIHFFGRQNLETIQRYRENCHFCLVPSTFLETFGLTALNSLSMGIPVIGFSKGGLSQFISDKYDISQTNGINDSHKLFNLLEKIIKAFNNGQINIEKEQKTAINTAKKYDIKKRIENIQGIIGKPKRILLVSDFKSKLGGIETYIHDVAKILKEKGYEVKIYGKKIPNGFWGKIMRYIGLVRSKWNFVDAIKLKILTRKFMPKIIWYHSSLRRLGGPSIKALSSYHAKKIVMYHDLGYFHPYPSKVTQESMIKYPLNLKNFISCANSKNPIKILAVCFKFWYLSAIMRQLKKNIDIHLVPSQFMESIVNKSFGIKKQKVKTLSHFIQG